MSANYKLVNYNDLTKPSATGADRHSHENTSLLTELHQDLPPLFASSLTGFLRDGDHPLASLFVASEEVLEQKTPARALVLTEDGVLFLEAGEVTLGSTSWGVKSLFYPYAHITAVGLGAALLTGRFTLHSLGSAPPCEIALHSSDLPRFEAVTRLISKRVADGDSR